MLSDVENWGVTQSVMQEMVSDHYHLIRPLKLDLCLMSEVKQEFSSFKSEGLLRFIESVFVTVSFSL